MKTSVILLRVGGIVNLLVGVLHVGFWRLFNWPEELARLSWENSNIMQMLNLFLIVFFFYTAFVLLLVPRKLLSNLAGRLFLGLFATLYLARMIMELYFPNGSVGFVIFMIITVLLFVLPLAQSKDVSYAS